MTYKTDLLTTTCSSRANVTPVQKINRSQVPTPQPNLSNVFKTSLEEDASAMRMLWVQEAKSRCQLNLLRKLLGQKVGTSCVEVQAHKILASNKSQDALKPRNRDENLVICFMRSKVKDALKCLKTITTHVGKVIKRIKNKYGP